MENNFNFDDNSAASNRELVMQLLSAFNSFKQKLEDPNYVQLEMSVRQIVEGQREMREDISELKRQLLNPYDGVIVETQKNSEHRREVVSQEAERLVMMEEHRALVKWKNNFQKVSIAVLSSVGAIAAWLLSEFVFKR